MYMPTIDHNFGNSSNHKRARIIERKFDFLDHSNADDDTSGHMETMYEI
jgi:hypothetical protein